MSRERRKILVSTDEEENNPSKKQDETEDFTANRRMYDCPFCKRGFTNAQALGGHMNIHRKDRAKSKNKKPSSSSSTSKHTIQNSDLESCHPVLESHNESYHQAPPNFWSPRESYGYDFYGNHGVTSDDQDLLGVDRGLGLGSMHVHDDVQPGNRRNEREDDVDLELRLGHHRQ